MKIVVTPIVERSFLRQFVGKAAQAQLGGMLPRGDGPEAAPVERIGLLFTRQNRLMEFGIAEFLGLTVESGTSKASRHSPG